MAGKIWQRLAILGLVALVAVSGSLTGCSRLGTSRQATSSVETVAVQRGNLAVTVNASGSLSFPKKSRPSFPVSGTVVELAVAVGDEVKDGQVIARLDDAPYKKAVLQAEANLKSAEIALNKVVSPYDTEDLRRAEEAVASARDALALAETDGTVAETQAARNLADAQEALDKAQTPYSDEDLAQAQAAVREAEASLALAQQDLALSRQDLPVAETQAARNLADAQETLDKAQTPYSDEDLAQAQTAVREAEASLELARRDLALSQQDLSLAETRSDRDTQDAREALDKATTAYRQQISPYRELRDEELFIDPNLLLEFRIPQSWRLLETYEAMVDAKAAYDIAQLQEERSIQAGKNAVARAEETLKKAEEALRRNQVKLSEIQSGADPADVAKLQEKLELTRLQGQRSVQAARNAVTRAEETQKKAEEALRRNQVKLAEIQSGADPADVAKLQEKLELTRIQGQRSVQAATESLARAEETVKKAQETLRRNQVKLAEIESGADPAEVAKLKEKLELTRNQGQRSVAAASNAVERAKETLRKAQADLAEMKAGTDADEIALKKLQVSLAQIALAEAQRDLEGTALKAPFAGVIASVNTDVGNRVGVGTVAVTLVDTSKVEVAATVDEIDVPQVQVGQQVGITLDALPGSPIPGRVKSVSPVGQVQAGVVSYPVVVEAVSAGAEAGQMGGPRSGSAGGLPSGRQSGAGAGRQSQFGSGMGQQQGTSSQLREGMTALATIVVEQRSDVLLVPARAVRSSGGKRLVEVVTSTGTVAQEITTGLSDGRNTEVVSGLVEGDKVLVQTASAASTPAPSGMGGGFPGGGMFR